jgi:hypothetical protein
MSDANAASEPETTEDEEISRIQTIYQAVKWRALEVGIKQLPDKSDRVDMLGAAMGLLGAAIWMSEQITNQTKDKEAFLGLVDTLWDEQE